MLENTKAYFDKVFEECGHDFRKTIDVINDTMNEICAKLNIPREGHYEREQEQKWNRMIDEEIGKLLED